MKQQRIIRLLALLCTLASLLSSVAFAAVTLPDTPVVPKDEIYIVVPADDQDYGVSGYPNGISEKKVPVRTEGARSANIAYLVSYYDEVYAMPGYKATNISTGKWLEIRQTYDETLADQRIGYLRGQNLVPITQMRRVSISASAALNYYASSADAGNLQKSLGSLTNGAAVRLISTTGNICCIDIYFPNATTGEKAQRVYIQNGTNSNYLGTY